MSWEPLAPNDPIPGDPEVSRQAAVHYDDVATAMGEAEAALGVIEEMDGFTSEAVEALRSKAEDVRGEITKAQSRYAAAAGALRIYAGKYQDAKDAARAAGPGTRRSGRRGGGRAHCRDRGSELRRGGAGSTVERRAGGLERVASEVRG